MGLTRHQCHVGLAGGTLTIWLKHRLLDPRHPPRPPRPSVTVQTTVQLGIVDMQGLQAEFAWRGTSDISAWLTVPSALEVPELFGYSMRFWTPTTHLASPGLLPKHYPLNLCCRHAGVPSGVCVAGHQRHLGLAGGAHGLGGEAGPGGAASAGAQPQQAAGRGADAVECLGRRGRHSRYALPSCLVLTKMTGEGMSEVQCGAATFGACLFYFYRCSLRVWGRGLGACRIATDASKCMWRSPNLTSLSEKYGRFMGSRIRPSAGL